MPSCLGTQFLGGLMPPHTFTLHLKLPLHAGSLQRTSSPALQLLSSPICCTPHPQSSSSCCSLAWLAGKVFPAMPCPCSCCWVRDAHSVSQPAQSCCWHHPRCRKSQPVPALGCQSEITSVIPTATKKPDCSPACRQVKEFHISQLGLCCLLSDFMSAPLSHQPGALC